MQFDWDDWLERRISEIHRILREDQDRESATERLRQMMRCLIEEPSTYSYLPILEHECRHLIPRSLEAFIAFRVIPLGSEDNHAEATTEHIQMLDEFVSIMHKQLRSCVHFDEYERGLRIVQRARKTLRFIRPETVRAMFFESTMVAVQLYELEWAYSQMRCVDLKGTALDGKTRKFLFES